MPFPVCHGLQLYHLHHFRSPTALEDPLQGPLTMHSDLHLGPRCPCLIGGLAGKEA